MKKGFRGLLTVSLLMAALAALGIYALVVSVDLRQTRKELGEKSKMLEHSHKKIEDLYSWQSRAIELENEVNALEKRITPGRKNPVVILCYLRIIPEAKTIYDVSVSDFEAQMKYLADNKYNFVSLRDVLRHMDSQTSFPLKAVALTFDDGDGSAYTYTYPILKKYVLPATFFVYSDCIELEVRGMKWYQMRQMMADGYDVECHSKMHSNMAKKYPGETDDAYMKRLDTELKDSKRILEEHLKREMRYFAYPYGSFNSFVERKAIEAGYESMFTISGGLNYINDNRYRLGRKTILGTFSMKEFVSIIAPADFKKQAGAR